MAAVDLHGGGVHAAHLGPHLLEDLQLDDHIADLGHILDAADAVDQDGGRNDGHDGVLCAADGHLAPQRFISIDDKFIQIPHSPGSVFQLLPCKMPPPGGKKNDRASFIKNLLLFYIFYHSHPRMKNKIPQIFT